MPRSTVLPFRLDAALIEGAGATAQDYVDKAWAVPPGTSRENALDVFMHIIVNTTGVLLFALLIFLIAFCRQIRTTQRMVREKS